MKQSRKREEMAKLHETEVKDLEVRMKTPEYIKEAEREHQKCSQFEKTHLAS